MKPSVALLVLLLLAGCGRFGPVAERLVEPVRYEGVAVGDVVQHLHRLHGFDIVVGTLADPGWCRGW